MFQKKIIDIYKEKKSINLPLFDTSSIIYPTIEGNTSNFLTDYGLYSDEFDLYAVRLFGSRYFDAILSEDESEILSEWNDTTRSIIAIHLEEWARLYYALSLNYNPIWNVDGTTVFEYGEKVRTDDYAERTRTDTIGETSGTNTEYATAYDSGTEKETGKTTIEEDERTNTSKDSAHLDTFTDEEHTDTETRSGNIGVTMTQQLLEAEWKLRRHSFFAEIIKQIMDECGTHYFIRGC